MSLNFEKLWRDWKYLIAYILPLSAMLALYKGGWWSFSVVFVAFVLVPLVELFWKGSDENLSAESTAQQLQKKRFDYLLYANVPLVLGIVAWYLYALQLGQWSSLEYWGTTLSIGIFIGSIGINVAHELGHRSTKHERTMAKILLLPNLYLHFIIEHNRGHHLNIATDEDPASSRYNESIYAFYWRSVVYSYLSAWKLEAKRLQRENRSFWHWSNAMLQYQGIQLLYLLGIAWFLGWAVMGSAILLAVFGFLMLESVNYIEHYGLRRERLASGKYERVQPWHSWNSDHPFGRILLYELTRHSDHHYKATRKYQILRHFDESPQLPFGYPGSMLLALVPPLWFRVMNPRVKNFQQKSIAAHA